MTNPFPLNNPVLGKMLQQQEMAKRTMQTGSGAPAPGPASASGIPDAQIHVTHGLPEDAPPPAPASLGAPQQQAPAAPSTGFSPQPVTGPPRALAGKINPIQPNANEVAAQDKLNHLAGTKPGWENIHNPVLRTLAGIGNAVGGGLFPNIAQYIPGTTLHHGVQTGEAGRQLKQEQGARKEANTEQEQAARATEQASLPEFHEAQNDVKRLTSENRLLADQGKTAEATAHHQGELDAKSQAQEINDRKAGYRRNAEGELEVIPPEEMTPQEHANFEFKSSQRELNEATAMLRKAQAERNPEHEALAMQRLDIANRRLALSSRQFEMRAHGTEGGVPLPGSLLTDENKPIGTAFQQNVRPTGTERTRADLAMSAHEQLNDMRAVIKKHPEFFGPGAGRKTQFVTWIGSQDPDAQKFLTARSILADHATGVFGARSEAAINAQKIAAGELKDNPDAILAGLNQIEKAMGMIKSRGVVKSTGSNDAKDAKPQTPDGRPPLSSFEKK